jgi:tetratricopeptide (TPR) repeat protein
MMKNSPFFLLVFFIAGCSTAPKPSPEVLTLRDSAYTQMDLANREADQGNYPLALELIGPARDLAIRTDDPVLLIKTNLSLGNVLFSLGRNDEALTAWEEAALEADRTGDKELGALCGIYRERGRLFTVLNGGGGGAAVIRDQVLNLLGKVINDRFAQALGWTVIGLAEKELRRYAEAEGALKKSAAIHDAGFFLEQAALDWYLIASVRSTAGDYDGALGALDEALDYDRRSENSYGLGKDWQAMGDVLTKAGRAAEAAAAYRRSAAIFAALEKD